MENIFHTSKFTKYSFLTPKKCTLSNLSFFLPTPVFFLPTLSSFFLPTSSIQRGMNWGPEILLTSEVGGLAN